MYTIGKEEAEAVQPMAGDRAARPDFMHPINSGQVFTSLDDARRASPRAGDVVLIRDLGKLAPAGVWTEAFVRGKWHLRPYQLADGQSGRLLMVCDFAGDEGPAAVPPEFEVKLDLPGWYAIWLGAPLMEHSANGGGGINVALDHEPGYAGIGPEANRFNGRWAHPINCEYLCYWKCAQLDKRTLRIRVPWGTYSVSPWGLVRGCFSALRLIRLSDRQAQAYLEDVADPSTKRGMVIVEGRGAWGAGEPGKGVDADSAMAWRNTDVGKYLLQTPCTGVANWPSKATSLVGDMVSEDEWKSMRKGDRREYDYVQWVMRNGQESFRVAAEVLKGSSTELHASLRMNLFLGGLFGKPINGAFWFEHPELRKPDSLQLDYAIPAVRAFIIGILMELASNYDLSGINMDFTRWPPVADPARHDFSVLTSFIKEVRRSLDKVQARKRRKLALSAHMVDDEPVYAGTLTGQKIDFDAWLATGVLDFVSVEARQPEKNIAIAKRYGVPYYASQDWGVREMFPNADPDMLMSSSLADPIPGDEFTDQKNLDRQFGIGVDSTDYDRAFAVRYAQGVDGVCTTNTRCCRAVSRMGHVEEVAKRAVTGAIWGQEPGPSITIS